MSTEKEQSRDASPGEDAAKPVEKPAYDYGARLLEDRPDLTAGGFAGALFREFGIAPEPATDLYDELIREYIQDPDFDGSVDTVREHYERVRPVYERFSDLDGAPTTGFFGNSGWYRSTYGSNDAGRAVEHRRAYTFEEDYSELVDGIEHDDDDSSWRSAYNIASWKDRDAVYDGIRTENSAELGQGDGLAGYADMRGFPLWVDLDLRDNDDGADGPNYKRRRGDLDDDVRETVERAYQAYAEEFADLLGIEPERVAVFDSGGGGYLYTPAAVTLPIAKWCEHEADGFGDARKLVFEELRQRFFAYGTGTSVSKNADDYGFTGIQARVNERVDGADEFLDPDWMQNRNRQSKAPLAIHGDHDIVVTPARPADEPGTIEYEPTPVSAVDDALIEHTAREAEKIVSVPDRDVLEQWTGGFVSTLFPEHSGDTDGWRATLNEWLTETRARKRAELRQRAREERRQRHRLQERVDDADSDDASQRSVGDMLTEIDVTPVRKDVFDALDGATKNGAEFTTKADVREWWQNDDDELLVDVRDVIREYAADEWRTADRGHEITFDPSWRESDSGQSCAVPNVDVEPETGEVSVGNVFIDNGADGAKHRCGPAKAYALGKKIIEPGEHAAAQSLDGKQWADAVEGLRADGYPIPVYIPEAGSEAPDGEPYEQTPLWALRKAAVALDVCDRSDFVEHETDGGETYLGFDGPTYDAVLRALDDEGIDHGREPIGTETRSEYYDADLAAYVSDGDPWTEPDTMLRAALRARDDGAVSEHAAPPKLALLPLRRDVLEQQPSRDMSSGTKALLKDLFHELTVDDLGDVLDQG
jgi:hypothetical protein